MIIMIIGIVVALIVVGYVIETYNSLVKLRNQVKDQWSQVDVLLKRRTDLIPNVVETVKGFAKHEEETLEKVISARNGLVNSKTKNEEMQADNQLTEALGRIMLLTEAYPELKANTNFLQLQDELSKTEDKIQYARQFYNDIVLKYKNKLETFPSNLIASSFKFEQEQYFEVSEKDRENVKVQF